MSDQEEYEKVDESYKILYTTFLLIGVFVFFWLLVAVFNENSDENEEIKNEDEEDEK